MRKLHLIILIISLFVAGCSTKSTRNAFLMHVDSLQRTNPDSAFNLLYENNTLFTTPEDKAYYSLLYCETFLKNRFSSKQTKPLTRSSTTTDSRTKALYSHARCSARASTNTSMAITKKPSRTPLLQNSTLPTATNTNNASPNCNLGASILPTAAISGHCNSLRKHVNLHGHSKEISH